MGAFGRYEGCDFARGALAVERNCLIAGSVVAKISSATTSIYKWIFVCMCGNRGQSKQVSNASQEFSNGNRKGLAKQQSRLGCHQSR